MGIVYPLGVLLREVDVSGLGGAVLTVTLPLYLNNGGICLNQLKSQALEAQQRQGGG